MVQRLHVREYNKSDKLYEIAAQLHGMQKDELDSLVLAAGARIRSTLNLSENPFQIDSIGVLAKGISGLVRVNAKLDLEIIPKFLSENQFENSWRADFYYLATLSRHGQLLANDRLSSSSSAERNLPTLVARAACDMFDVIKHRPLRHYERERFRSFRLTGEPDYVDMLTPHEEGFLQEALTYDLGGHWNTTISQATDLLLQEISDPLLRLRLNRISKVLGKASRTRHQAGKPVPPRHKSWEPLYMLADDIVRGFGLNYSHGAAMAPGYVVSTWQVWEDLISTAAKIGFGFDRVRLQPPYRLAKRIFDRGSNQATVRPDILVEGTDGLPNFIIDAKYKTNSRNINTRISEADVYESMAFSKATELSNIVLLYPGGDRSPALNLGDIVHFETVKMDGLQIIGLEVGVSAVSKMNGLVEFSSKLSAGIQCILNEATY